MEQPIPHVDLGTLALFHLQVSAMFKECKVEEMPPHIFAVAAAAHKAMLKDRKDQSIVLAGRSGAGKTANAMHVLNYYAANYASGKSACAVTADKLAAARALLDSFGQARTLLNARATRHGALFSVDFDSAGALVSASVQTMLLEKARVVRRPEGEPTFNIFYQMLAGLDSRTRRELGLESLGEPNLFMTPLSRVSCSYNIALVIVLPYEGCE